MSTTEKPYTGLTALVMLNGTTIGYINSVELSLEKDIAEILQFGAQYREKLPTIKNWTASSDGTVAFASGGAQHKLYQAFETGELVTLRIKLDSAVYFEGKALIGSLSLSGSPDAQMDISVDFEGSGGITFSLPETVIATIHSTVGGTTNPAGVVRCAKGAALNIEATAATGYTISGYKLNGGALVADTSSPVTVAGESTNADLDVEVVFAAS